MQQFLPYLSEEVAALGDGTMQQEVQLLAKLAQI